MLPMTLHLSQRTKRLERERGPRAVMALSAGRAQHAQGPPQLLLRVAVAPHPCLSLLLLLLLLRLREQSSARPQPL